MPEAELYHIVEVATLRSVGPTSHSPGLLYEWAERDGWGLGTVAVMRLRGVLKFCHQSKSTVVREANRYRREVENERAMDKADEAEFDPR